MKVRKRILTILIVVICATQGVLLTGCNPSESEVVDNYRTQLYVTSYNGGFGSDWLYLAKARFEEKYKDESFEPGVTYKGVEKKGVQIVVLPDKIKTAEQHRSMTRVSGQDVYFIEDVRYLDWVGTENAMLDITDIVTENLNEKYGEEGSIEDKLSQQHKDFLNWNGAYYAIPHYESHMGISYNVDLFEEFDLYFSKDGGFVFDGTDIDERSAGPDGKYGTYDDGLPVTYSDFFELCDRIAQKNIQPIHWSGGYSQYSNGVMLAQAVNIEGPEQWLLNYDFEGTAKNIISVNSNNGKLPETITPRGADVPITPANGYELFQSAGRYYALKFYETILNNETYYDPVRCWNQAVSHIGAQEDFLYGGYLRNKPRIAMIQEGSWWWNEAKGIFNDMANKYTESASRMNRRFGFMPMPKPDADMVPNGVSVSEGLTLLDATNAFAFINGDLGGDGNTSNGAKKADIAALAKRFLQFCYTNESLVEFSMETGTPKALQYELAEEDLDRLPYYAKTLLGLKQNATVVYPASQSTMFSVAANLTTSNCYGPPALWAAGSDTVPMIAMKNGMTAEAYFNAMGVNFSAAKWANSYGV